MKLLHIAALAAALACSAVHAQDAAPGKPAGKTRAEVIAEMQAARAAGQLNKPDYYPVFERSWNERRQAPAKDAAK
ncbi:DUF4148 domain-containing protein [Herbaspirillum sp. WKF16]|uniref:DUF4148 domain-containing protein n=1 Tax=Herbaspirillum sp. WKF16 TaxID=3028312 RepID=UPI0023A918F6|nr:DUF4148 domain-containing protein [Herbaspirillum sp. WKF16]WDZ94819.1 DUF4148 domain-containing protein [Herbaspirillum sp. WKF16]